MARICLQLFIRGDNPRHQRAVGEVRSLCAMHLNGHCDLQVIDIVRSPELAEQYKILATPALVKIAPAPIHRMIGDFSSIERVAAELGICLSCRGKNETQ